MNTDSELKESLKDLLRKIKGETDPARIDAVRRDFKGLLSRATPLMIAQAEQELVGEGFTQTDLVSACDVHLELFRESMAEAELDVPADHPVARFQKDHRLILDMMEDLRDTLKRAREKGGTSAAAEDFARAKTRIEKLLDAENHNVRQENTLFPLLERHGLEQPPAIMWMEHTEMKEEKKTIKLLLEKTGETDFAVSMALLEGAALRLLEKFASHTLKEKNILYAAALEVLSEEEWKDIREECDNLGYFEEG
jgi:hypothetical protein